MKRTTTTRAWAVGITLALVGPAACERPPEAPKTEQAAPAPEQAAPIQDEAPEAWGTVSTEELDEEARAKLEKANAARTELAGRLMQRVMQVSQEEGFVAAVDVCHGEAPTITAEVAEKHGLRLGRTSDKLRNPDNTGPQWATHLYNEAGTPAIVRGPDGAIGTLNPISLAEPCASCHGTRDQLAPGVADILAERYPDDRATGYAPGDLRGWFWVEVPGS